MLLTLFQNETIGVALYGTIAVLFVVGLILLKIGLRISKAETRTSFKWLLGSYGIQVGMFFFVGSPLILFGIVAEQETDVALIIIFVILAVFMDIHLLNFLHQLGIKRALLVFALISIPFILVSISVITLIVMAID